MNRHDRRAMGGQPITTPWTPSSRLPEEITCASCEIAGASAGAGHFSRLPEGWSYLVMTRSVGKAFEGKVLVACSDACAQKWQEDHLVRPVAVRA